MPDRAQAVLIALLVLLSACTPRDLLVSGAGATGIAAMQERGIGGAMSDYSLRLAINETWFYHSVDLYQRASLMISRGRVVIIGRVPTQEMKDMAGTLAVGAGAVNPLNRLTIGPDLSVGTKLSDESLALRLDGTYSFDGDVRALNYDVEVRDGVVYLIGEAVSEREKRRVIYVASHFSGVRAVESYINVVENAQ